MNRREEYELQCAVAHYLRLQLPHDVFWTAISHGVNLGGTQTERKIRGARLKRAGHKPGVADIMICSRDVTIWIELKAKRGHQSPEQKEFMRAVESIGHRYVICKSLDDIRAALRDWELIP